MITNYVSFVSFIISVICILVYLFFLTPRQFTEVLKPQDYLTNLRKIILALLILTLVTSIPPTIYQFFRATGHEYDFLRNLSSLLSNISKAGTTLLLVLVYTYRKKEK